LILVLLAIIPTIIYYISIYKLGLPEGNIDSGAVLGSYLGLFLLSSAYTAVGIFASSVTKNQVVAFAIAVFLCFIAYSGFDALSRIFELRFLESFFLSLSINEHYKSISRGVIDTRDIVYFLTFAIVFLGLTKAVVGGRKW
jgi:ABC-2 type transport system permease protein